MMLKLTGRRLVSLPPPVFRWRRAGCEMKRGIRSGAAHVESSHRQAAPHLPHSLAAWLLPCSFLRHPTLTRGLGSACSHPQ